MEKSIEDKIEKKQAIKEMREIFPNYGETITIKEGERNFLCRIFGHKERHIHHQFFAKETERGKERYEVYVCPRCKDIEGKLVHIEKIA